MRRGQAPFAGFVVMQPSQRINYETRQAAEAARQQDKNLSAEQHVDQGLVKATFSTQPSGARGLPGAISPGIIQCSR